MGKFWRQYADPISCHEDKTIGLCVSSTKKTFRDPIFAHIHRIQ